MVVARTCIAAGVDIDDHVSIGIGMDLYSHYHMHVKSAVFYVDAHVHNHVHVHVHIHVLEYQEEYDDRKGVVGLDWLYAADVHDDNNADEIDIDAAPALAVGIDIDVARKETAMSMQWLASTFDVSGEAYTTPFACQDYTAPNSAISRRPIFLPGSYTAGLIHPTVSTMSHGLLDTLRDATSFPHSVIISLDFFLMERARAAMFAHALLQLGVTTLQSAQSLCGQTPTLDNCHKCLTSVPKRWCIRDQHGSIAISYIEQYTDEHISTNKKRSPPFDTARDSVTPVILKETKTMFKSRAHHQGIMTCWVCTVPVVCGLIQSPIPPAPNTLVNTEPPLPVSPQRRSPRAPL